MKRILVTAGLLYFFLVGSNVFAQSRISGTVNDASGALIPGVTVTATNVATGVMTTVVSNDTGAYNFASLPPGTYKLTSELPGFQGQTYDNVALGQSDQLRFNFKLTVASVAQAVEVTVDAQAVLTATSASVGQAIEQKKVEELPMVREDILDLVRIMPGMRVDPFGDQWPRQRSDPGLDALRNEPVPRRGRMQQPEHQTPGQQLEQQPADRPHHSQIESDST